MNCDAFLAADGWILTASGRQFWPLTPRVEDVSIEDIAHALANVCRFTGHVRTFYSVAQHSVIVSHLCEPRHALYGLLHDGSEAYLSDIARPVKHTPEFAGYRVIERRLQEMIYQAFGLDADEPPDVKAADNVALVTEKRDLMPDRGPAWHESIRHVPVMAEKIVPQSPVLARLAFLTRFGELTRGKR